MHGPADNNTPAFCDIVIPAADCKGYVARIRLFDRFPSLVASLTDYQEEVIQPVVEPKLRTAVPKVGGVS
jgi:hypothetical protein